jgi:hypothetical protein
MRILLAIFCLALFGRVLPQNTTQSPLYRIISRFDPATGALFYDMLDANGNTIQRIEQLYAVPPVAVCNQTIWSLIQQSLAASMLFGPIGLNISANTSLYCCDYYSSKIGYQFT